MSEKMPGALRACVLAGRGTASLARLATLDGGSACLATRAGGREEDRRSRDAGPQRSRFGPETEPRVSAPLARSEGSLAGPIEPASPPATRRQAELLPWPQPEPVNGCST